MKFRKTLTTLTLILFLGSNIVLPSTLFAHPGRTAGDGGHYCRTNCSRWGVPWNRRHFHGRSAPAPKKRAPKKRKAKSSTRIALKAGPKKIRKNRRTKLVATFLKGRKRLKRQVISFQIKKGRRWKTFRRKRSNSRGNAVVYVRLRKSTFFRAVFGGTSTLKKSSSRRIKVKVVK